MAATASPFSTKRRDIPARWGEDNAERERKYAAELVALAPDVIFASGTLSVAALQTVSRTLPIVFAAVTDPVGAGFVNSLTRLRLRPTRRVARAV
jgi:putative tryptophan/tyrosine transport system substrate-binding protein